jgi:hypothetical protein
MTLSESALDAVIAELLNGYNIRHAPIPIEAILQQPLPDMWEQVDLAELSGTFYALNDPYGPRLALARLLIRLLSSCAWGGQRGLAELDGNPSAVYRAARALLMPRAMLTEMPASALNPTTISALYQVPLPEAEQRLIEVHAWPPLV